MADKLSQADWVQVFSQSWGRGGVCVSLSELLQVSKPQFVHADSDAHLEVPDAR